MRPRRACCSTLVALVVAVFGACASPPRAGVPAPRVADFPRPDIPGTVLVPAGIRAMHLAAWDALQAMEAQRAGSEFTQILAQHPSFYPAKVGLGFSQIARRRYAEAEATFAAALRDDDRYVPAWIGRAEALLAAGRPVDAVESLERVVALDRARPGAMTRLELVRLRATLDLTDQARRARSAGRLDEAEQHLEHAWLLAPANTAVIRELVSVEMLRGRLDEAEGHAARAVALEPTSGQWHALLGDVLEARFRYRDAAAAYNRASALDPRPTWHARALDLREKAESALLPASFAHLTSAPMVTRAETAAFLAIHLDAVVIAAPRRVADIAVDIRTHWAATWIVPVTRAGVMSIHPNHTFLPDTPVNRVELARIAATLIPMVTANRPAELATWRAARPAFTDLPRGHAAYSAAAFATAAGAVAVGADGRFAPVREVSGQELDRAVGRINALRTR